MPDAREAMRSTREEILCQNTERGAVGGRRRVAVSRLTLRLNCQAGEDEGRGTRVKKKDEEEANEGIREKMR